MSILTELLCDAILQSSLTFPVAEATEAASARANSASNSPMTASLLASLMTAFVAFWLLIVE